MNVVTRISLCSMLFVVMSIVSSAQPLLPKTGPFEPTWNRFPNNTIAPIGSAMPSLESGPIGVRTVWQSTGLVSQTTVYTG